MGPALYLIHIPIYSKINEFNYIQVNKKKWTNRQMQNIINELSNNNIRCPQCTEHAPIFTAYPLLTDITE